MAGIGIASVIQSTAMVAAHAAVRQAAASSPAGIGSEDETEREGSGDQPDQPRGRAL